MFSQKDGGQHREALESPNEQDPIQYLAGITAAVINQVVPPFYPNMVLVSVI